jgi:copper(I)-binding protein
MRRVENLKMLICVLMMGLLSLSAKAETNHASADMHAEKKSDIQAHMGWVRAVPPVAVTTAAYMMLHNYSKHDDQVISIETPVAGAVEIHASEMSDGTMKMFKLENVTVPAKGYIMFEPAGYHIMLINIKQPLKVGDMVPLTLVFKNHGRVNMQLPVSHPPKGGEHEGMDHGTIDHGAMDHGTMDHSSHEMNH